MASTATSTATSTAASPFRVFATSNFKPASELQVYWSKLMSCENELVAHAAEADLVLVVNAPHPADAGELSQRRSATPVVVTRMEPHMGTKHAGMWGPVWSQPTPASLAAAGVQGVQGVVEVWAHETHLNMCEWHLAQTYTELAGGCPLSGERKRRVCAVLSSKYTDPGQVLRVDFARRLGDAGIAVDTYGLGGNPWSLPNWGGAVATTDVALGQYAYSMNMENHCIVNYVTEKFWDCVLAETYMFYWGAPNIKTIVPARFHGCFTVLMLDESSPDDTHKTAVQQVRDAICRDAYGEAKRQGLFKQFAAWVLENVSMDARFRQVRARLPAPVQDPVV